MVVDALRQFLDWLFLLGHLLCLGLLLVGPSLLLRNCYLRLLLRSCMMQVHKYMRMMHRIMME
jgi:hypothetical protein